MNAPLMNDDSSNNNISCGMKRSSPDNGAPAANKCQRIDESMIGKPTSSQDVLTTTTSSASTATSSINNNVSCDCEVSQDVATEETTSIIIDNIFSNNTSAPPSSSQRNDSIQRRQQAQQLLQQSNPQAAAPPPSREAVAATTSSATLSSSSSAAIRCKKSMVQSPHDFFTETLKSRGYPATTSCSLKSGYHSTPTKHQMTSYGISLTRAIRSSDIPQAQTLLSTGLNPNACNKFGESIIHAVCRRGDHDMLRVLLDAGSSVQVSDDYGRTPLHDACWTPNPNFETISLLLEKDPWLLSITDCRGSTPLGYVRKAHWGVWIGFLGAIVDRYWPSTEQGGEVASEEDKDNATTADERMEQEQAVDVDKQQKQQENISPKVPPLSLQEPNSSPILDPPNPKVKCLDILGLLANGIISPQELDEKNVIDTIQKDHFKATTSTPFKKGGGGALNRITFDPLRSAGTNATVMKGSQEVGAGYIRVNDTLSFR